MPDQEISRETNPKTLDLSGIGSTSEVERRIIETYFNVVLLTKEEAAVLYRNLMNVWLNRDDNYVLAKDTVERLGRLANDK